ncbi:hypothetical protein ACA910_018517 [Epithemia clementina (nom. ined.)]
MQGISMLKYVQLHLSAFERQGAAIMHVVHKVTGLDTPWRRLQPMDWFTQPQDTDGWFLWFPPPCLGDIAVYLMAEAIHIRPWNHHLFILPSIMGGRCRKLLYKTSDFLVTLPFGEHLWPKELEYEPLTMAFVFPALLRNPWRIKCSDLQDQREHTVRTLHQQSVPLARDYLCKFWVQARALATVSPGIPHALFDGATQAQHFPSEPRSDSAGDIR